VKVQRACACLFVCAALALVAADVDAAPSAGSPPRTTTRSATVAYPGCPAHAVTLSLGVPRVPVPAGMPVRFTVTLHNASPRACGPHGSTVTITGARSLGSALLNPCGALPLAIDNERNEQVYPPFEAISCPDLVAPTLEGDSSVTASETWSQRIGGAGRPARRAHPAPRGTYNVVVGTVLRAPLVLAPARSSSAGRGGAAPDRTATVVSGSGAVAFEGCSDIVATVAVPARSGAPVRYTVKVANVGSTTCGPPASQVRPGPPMLTVGACGVLPAVARNAAGDDIDPGPVAFFCPMEALIDLPTHGSVIATGSWTGTQALGPAPPQVSAAPPGRYRIEVGQGSQVVSVPFTLDATPAAPSTTVP
jgi:hypothetical protein